MDAPDPQALHLDLEAHNLNVEPFTYQPGQHVSVSASVSNEDATVKYQINNHSSIGLTLGKDHAFLNYKLTF